MGGATKTKSANARKATWASIVRRRCAIRNAWTAAIAQRRQFAHAPRDTKDDTAKEVMVKWNFNFYSIYSRRR